MKRKPGGGWVCFGMGKNLTNEFCSSVDFITILPTISKNHEATRFNSTSVKAPQKNICGNDQTMFKFNLTK